MQYNINDLSLQLVDQLPGDPISLGINYEYCTQYRKATSAVIRRYALQATARWLRPKNRVAWCHRKIAYGEDHVEIWKTKETANFRKMAACGSVWDCAVCSARISEVRKNELEQAYQESKKRGYWCYFLTLTFSHKKSDRINILVNSFNQVIRKFRNSRTWKGFVDTFGVIGTVTAFETTWGLSGWHPHKHILIFTDRKIDNLKDMLEEWEGLLFDAYNLQLVKHGLSAKEGIGLKLDFVAEKSDLIARYISKWTVEIEITKSNQKKGRKENLSVNDLLILAFAGKTWAADLWIEYSKAMFRKNQLTWTPGLKKRLGLVQDVTDQEAAEGKADQPSDYICSLGYWDLKKILANDIRGEVLLEAAKGLESLKAYLKLFDIEIEVDNDAERLDQED
jgi:hypothetical protein